MTAAITTADDRTIDDVNSLADALDVAADKHPDHFDDGHHLPRGVPRYWDDLLAAFEVLRLDGSEDDRRNMAKTCLDVARGGIEDIRADTRTGRKYAALELLRRMTWDAYVAAHQSEEPNLKDALRQLSRVLDACGPRLMDAEKADILSGAARRAAGNVTRIYRDDE